jgi:hypothetical protein
MADIGVASGDPSHIGGERLLIVQDRLAVHIEFQDAGHHDDGLRPIAVLEHGVLQCFDTIDEQPAAGALFVLDYPVASRIPTDAEY